MSKRPIEDKERPTCSCGTKMELTEVVLYEGDVGYLWVCRESQTYKSKCNLDEHKLIPDS